MHGRALRGLSANRSHRKVLDCVAGSPRQRSPYGASRLASLQNQRPQFTGAVCAYDVSNLSTSACLRHPQSLPCLRQHHSTRSLRTAYQEIIHQSLIGSDSRLQSNVGYLATSRIGSNYDCYRKSFHTSSIHLEKNGNPGKVPAREDGQKIKGIDDNPPIESTGSERQAASFTTGGASKQIRDRFSQIPQIHRPTRDELLAAATGFWSRLKVRFKWFSIRSARPFNVDEISAFFSWVLLGHVLWIILGTTTFFSLAILAVNTVFAQETLARWVGNYLTKSSGIKVVFESAIVPRWGDGVITFKNVFVSRRPGQGKARVSKGSPSTEAAAAAAAAKYEKANSEEGEEEEDTNYTQFDLSLDTVNVTLSFRKWFNSKGLLRDVEIQGIRGVIDRTAVHSTGDDVDPRSYKHEHSPGDFEINSFKMQDLLVTVHQPNHFRPFTVAIFSCDLPQLRRQWLFYDFLSANTMSGTVDDSMFSIHPRQDPSFVGSHLGGDMAIGERANPWKKHSRLRIDALDIDHLNRGVGGPFSWIREGNVDIVADISFPADNDESLAKLMTDFYDRMEATVTSRPTQGQDSEAQIYARSSEDDKRFLVMDLRVHLNDIRAAVPLFTRDLSYVNNAFVRPIVAYMNSRRTFIPIHCRVVKRASEFDGSWTIYDSGLMDDLSAEVCESCDLSIDLIC